MCENVSQGLSKKTDSDMLHNHDIKKNIFAAEDELQHSMNGVCMWKFLNRKVMFWKKGFQA